MEARRHRVAVAGTSSYIGKALCDTLGDRFDVIALTRSMAGSERSGGHGGLIERRVCDHFSRSEVESALQGVDYAVYLVHNRDPSARLDQAQTRDMDLLVADNFARAAARAGVQQIIYRSPLISNPLVMPDVAEDASELVQVLSSYGVPVTVLRTCLIIGPGGEIIRLLVRIVQKLPVIPIPQQALTVRRPISLSDLLRAFQYCVGNPETFGRQYDVIGPEPVTLRRMVEEAAVVLGKRRRLVRMQSLPDWSLVLLFRLIYPSMQREFLSYFLEVLRSDTNGRDNPVQGMIAQHAPPFHTSFKACILNEQKGIIEKQEHRRRERDDEVIRLTSRVRSIQRLALPAGKNAPWVAAHYVDWLNRIARPFMTTEVDPDGSWRVIVHPGRFTLLTLAFEPSKSFPDRTLYFITGGLLARYIGGRTARLEFRDLLNGKITIAAIHDFNPALPWLLYRFTQAVMHALVMKGFQRHMARLAAKN